MPVRRAAPPAAAAPVEYELFDAGDLSAYAAGKSIPEGDYAMEFVVMNYQATNQAGATFGKPRTGVMLYAHPLAGGDPIEQFVSMGTNTRESWAPHPEHGKSLVKIPVNAGGKGVPPTNKSNWHILLETMYQCGLPAGFFKNDFSVLDGIWAHVKPMPEPEERKNFRKNAATGEEQAEEEVKGSGMVPHVTAILPGGRVWVEGEGGFEFQTAPATSAKRTAPVAAPAPAAPAARPAPPRRAVGAAPVAPPPQPPAAEGDGEELIDIAQAAIGDVLVDPTNANGIKRLKLRLAAHSAIKAKYDDQTATDVVNQFLNSEDGWASVLGPIGYRINGAGPQADIVPQ